MFYFYPYLGKWSNLTNIFQRGWNHQLVNVANVERVSWNMVHWSPLKLRSFGPLLFFLVSKENKVVFGETHWLWSRKKEGKCQLSSMKRNRSPIYIYMFFLKNEGFLSHFMSICVYILYIFYTWYSFIYGVAWFHEDSHGIHSSTPIRLWLGWKKTSKDPASASWVVSCLLCAWRAPCYS